MIIDKKSTYLFCNYDDVEEYLNTYMYQHVKTNAMKQRECYQRTVNMQITIQLKKQSLEINSTIYHLPVTQTKSLHVKFI